MARHTKRIVRTLGRLTLAAAVTAGIGGQMAGDVAASDHIDAPILAQDHAADLNDTYAFLDPNDNSRLVIIMTTNPFIISAEAIGQSIFDHNLRYRFEIENTGDAVPDMFVDVRFGAGVGRFQPQSMTLQLHSGTFRDGDPQATGTTTVALQDDVPSEPVINTDEESDIIFFGGIADDPFFLDNTGANRLVVSTLVTPGNPRLDAFEERTGSDGVGRDTYSGFNTLAIAVSLPLELIRGDGDVIGVNAVTQRQIVEVRLRNNRVRRLGGRFTNVDRSGTPLVVNGLIPPPRKDEYNGATTLDDANGRFRADLITSLNNLGTNEASRNMLLRMIQENGDILRLDLRVPNTGPGGGNNTSGGPANMGGRRLQDDVADATFTLINNGVALGDFVDRNDAPFRDTFPFVAFPIQPNPKGINNPDTRIRL